MYVVTRALLETNTHARIHLFFDKYLICYLCVLRLCCAHLSSGGASRTTTHLGAGSLPERLVPEVKVVMFVLWKIFFRFVKQFDCQVHVLRLAGDAARAGLYHMGHYYKIIYRL